MGVLGWTKTTGDTPTNEKPAVATCNRRASTDRRLGSLLQHPTAAGRPGLNPATSLTVVCQDGGLRNVHPLSTLSIVCASFTPCPIFLFFFLLSLPLLFNYSSSLPAFKKSHGDGNRAMRAGLEKLEALSSALHVRRLWIDGRW